MKRAIKIRQIQIKEIAITTSYIVLGFVILGAIFTLLNIPSNFSGPTNTRGVVNLISSFLGLFILLFSATDGISDFDTSLRLGISRKQYFLINLVIYIVLAVINQYLSHWLSMDGSTAAFDTMAMSKGEFTYEFILLEFILNMMFTFICYGIYRFGMKFLMIIAGVFMLASIMFGGLSYMFIQSGNSQAVTFLGQFIRWLIDNKEIVATLAAIVTTYIYYRLVTKTNIRS